MNSMSTQEVQWDGVMRAIADSGFQGYVAHEFVPTGDPLVSLRKAVDCVTCDGAFPAALNCYPELTEGASIPSAGDAHICANLTLTISVSRLNHTSLIVLPFFKNHEWS